LTIAPINNSGDIRSAASAPLEIFSSDSLEQKPSSHVAATTELTQTIRLNIAPGRTRVYRFRLTPAMVQLANQSNFLFADLLSNQEDPTDPSEIFLPITK
jgi:hypothetical protein